MKKNLLMIFLLLTLLTVACSQQNHLECGYSPSFEYKKMAQNLGIIFYNFFKQVIISLYRKTLKKGPVRLGSGNKTLKNYSFY